MNKIENGVIKYQIAFEKYKNGYTNEILKLFDEADREISRYIKLTDSVATKARYKAIATKIREIAKELKTKIEENTDIDGVIAYELKKQRKLFDLAKPYIKKIKNGQINFVFPSVEQIRASALFKPASDTLTYQSYLNGIEAGLFNTWDSAVRTGYLTGQTTQQIVRNVIGGVSQIDKLKKGGTIQPLRTSVVGNTRTLLQSFAEETREQVYRENEEYFGNGEYKYEWLSTLDSRSCLVCADLDGKLFKTIEDAQPIPKHRNCRCILLPYFNIDGDKRASKNGYVESKTTFSQWLDEQDEETKKDVLGASRYKLYKDGVKLNQFVDNGEILTLEELYETLDL